MRDFRDAKAMAQSLRQALSAKNIPVSHSDSLELIAQSFGFENWNILSAKIGGQRSELASKGGPDSSSSPPLLHCSFCGKSQDEVKKLIAGPDSFICNECVDLCNGMFDLEELRAAMRSAESEGRDPRQSVAEVLSGWGEKQIAEYLKRSQAMRETVPPIELDETDENLIAWQKITAEYERLNLLIGEILEARSASQA